jgi:predicted phosphodiesterase
MRIALLSDIHGNLPALEAVAADIQRRGADLIVNLGDSLSGPLLPRETAQYLMASGWLSLAGNHERQILTHSAAQRGASDAYAHAQLGETEFAWLRSLPATHLLAQDVFLCHGTPTSDLHYFFENAVPGGTLPATADEVEARLGGVQAAAVACGHTHIPRALRSRAGQLLCNPGSVGLAAYDDLHPVEHIVQNGSPDARYATIEQVGSAWHATLHSVPYDYEPMARLAELHGRPEWAYALRTGYMNSPAG